jgi:hypothetical protein
MQLAQQESVSGCMRLHCGLWLRCLWLQQHLLLVVALRFGSACLVLSSLACNICPECYITLLVLPAALTVSATTAAAAAAAVLARSLTPSSAWPTSQLR